MQKFWSIPAIALYFYVATVLTNYGFLSYFSIPSSFIQSSLSGNIVFSYQYLTASGTLLSEMHWWTLFAIGGAIGIMLALYCFVLRFKKGWKKVFIVVATVALFLWLGTFFSLGSVIASTSTNFLVLYPACPSVGSAANYIVVVIDGNTTVLVPIDQNNKMAGGFLVKNTADLSCALAWKPIGHITP